MNLIIGYLLALVIGISLSLLGAGGSILAVPILKYFFGMSTSEAIPASLVIVGFTSAVVTLVNFFQGKFNIKEDLGFIFVFLACSSLGSWIGAKIASYISPDIRFYTFILLMIIAATNMLLQTNNKNDLQTTDKVNVFLVIFVALAVGLTTGIVGIGGGFMIVPALTLFLHFPIKKAIESSLFIITINAFTATLGYLGEITLPWGKLLPFLLVTLLGIAIGNPLSKKIEQEQLRGYFAIFLFSIAAVMLVKEFFF